MTQVAELISTFDFWRGYRRRNRFEDDVAAAIAADPDACFAVATPELRSPVATRRAGAAVIAGRLVEVTQSRRFVTGIERDLMAALDVERSIRVAEELGTALSRAWGALGKSVDLVEMARDARPAYRLAAASELAFMGESPQELAELRRLTGDKVPRIRWWAEFGLAPPDA